MGGTTFGACAKGHDMVGVEYEVIVPPKKDRDNVVAVVGKCDREECSRQYCHHKGGWGTIKDEEEIAEVFMTVEQHNEFISPLKTLIITKANDDMIIRPKKEEEVSDEES